MPGEVSSSFDPEFGTGQNAAEITDALNRMYEKVSRVIGSEPMYIMDLVRADLPDEWTETFTEKEWRIIRFALERAADSI